MDNETKIKLEKFLAFAEKADIHASLPVVEELQAIRKVLEALLAKEMPPFPEIPACPMMPEMDMTETNELLKKIAKKEDEPIEVVVKLDIK